MFELDSRLVSDTVVVGDFPLCRLLMHRDANYPWFILVPRLEAVTEIYHLSEEDRQQLMRESCQLAEALVDVALSHSKRTYPVPPAKEIVGY